MGRLLKVTDHVDQCYSNADGDQIRTQLLQNFEVNEKVIVSFQGLDSVSSSFINSAFIDLLENYDFKFIKNHLGFKDTTRPINEAIRDRFSYEVNDRKQHVKA
ncbi:STAS-like domain-containing protein [Paenibacillus sp. FSL H3-0457]|uniref:STAS-like domain-containing protein n=1 Tax=Paenibacillus sp. FSL H3-0457 TaxID=2921430 RepID=UPI0030EEEB72